ncbi:MAG: PQQ-binding-like beta-propeller repeat protein [bacterium]
MKKHSKFVKIIMFCACLIGFVAFAVLFTKMQYNQNEIVFKGNSDGAMFMGNLKRTGVTQAGGPSVFNEVVWQFKTGDRIVATPAVDRETVFFSSMDNYLYALDLNNGDLRWKFKGDEFFSSSPAVSGDLVFIGSHVGTFYAINSASGEEIWNFKGREGRIYSSPAVYEGIVYFACGRYLYALNAKTGRELWRYKGQDLIVSSPAIHDGTIFFGDYSRFLYAADTKTGKIVWKLELKKGMQLKGNAPALSDGSLYIIDSSYGDSYLRSINSKTGQQIWELTYDTRLTSLAVSGDILYCKSSKNIFAVNLKNGSFISKLEVDSPIYSPMTLSNNIIYVGGKPYFYALDAQLDKIIFRLDFGHLESGSVVSDGIVIFGTEQGNLYAIR